jgi:hypothetical protein
MPLPEERLRGLPLNCCCRTIGMGGFKAMLLLHLKARLLLHLELMKVF